ncbi:hypothetical protein [Proteiniphilum acetatigenes]|uniref:hypothetical protein n=1 Tax=Proteiniphilum acetatigenes TaxID=294710 RepID=UPI00036C3A64|nr:hypothetical protein [Proteiniphilum acetatigenes]SFL42772.1 hypothetical protein SAMN05216357_12248 [Porphyromonadaceae bacterium KH3CP3RA]
MKAKAEDIEIGEESGGAINLRFKHLSSVARFHIIENEEAPIEGYLSGLTLRALDYAGLIHPLPSNTFPFFPVEAYLEEMDDDSLTPIEPSKQTNLHVFGDLSFVDKGTHREIDFFVPISPTGVPSDLANHRLTFETQIVTQTETGTNYSQDRLGTYFGLSFNNQLSFMPKGFEAGKSYYFNLKTSVY